MSDDGQPQPGTAGFARTAGIGPVEAFEDARQVLGFHAAAGVAHPDPSATIVDLRKEHDLAGRGVTQRVFCEVAQNLSRGRGIDG